MYQVNFDGRSWTAIFAMITALSAAGCQSKPVIELPKTYPVRGRVTNKAGSAVESGMVEFRSVTDDTMRAVGEIQSDGTFSLRSIVQTEMVDGAIAGSHRVSIYRRMAGAHAPQVHNSPQPQTVRETDNEITLKVPW